MLLFSFALTDVRALNCCCRNRRTSFELLLSITRTKNTSIVLSFALTDGISIVFLLLEKESSTFFVEKGVVYLRKNSRLP